MATAMMMGWGRLKDRIAAHQLVVRFVHTNHKRQGPVALGISFTTFDFLKRTLNVQPPHKKAPL